MTKMKPQDVENQLLEIYGKEALLASDLHMLRSQLVNSNETIWTRGCIMVLAFLGITVLTIGLGIWYKSPFTLLGGLISAFLAWYVWKTISPFKGIRP